MMLLRGDADLPARAARARLRPCRFCPANVEDDAQAAAMHLMFCPRAAGQAKAAEQVKTAWAFRLGERVTDVLNRAERT